MRSRTRNWVYSGLVLALLAGSQTGCKSGWKMPGADMFSWGRKPSESTIMGQGPTVSPPGSAPGSMTANASRGATTPSSTTSNGAMSPALRSTPNQVASSAVNPSSPSRGPGPGFGGYGPNTATPNGAANTAIAPGAAATANGYTTGAYATNQSRPQMNGTPSAYGQPMVAPQVPSPQMPVAQGSSPLPTANPNYSFPGGALPQTYAGMTVPPVAPPVAGGPQGALPPPINPNVNPMIPPPAGSSMARTASGGFGPTTPSGLPAMPVSSGAGAVPNLPPASQMPVAYGGSAPSSMPTMTPPASQASNRYLPGSVGRNTPYDFSNQGPGAAPAAPTGSVPKTATDPSRNMNR